MMCEMSQLGGSTQCALRKTGTCLRCVAAESAQCSSAGAVLISLICGPFRIDEGRRPALKSLLSGINVWALSPSRTSLRHSSMSCAVHAVPLLRCGSFRRASRSPCLGAIACAMHAAMAGDPHPCPLVYGKTDGESSAHVLYSELCGMRRRVPAPDGDSSTRWRTMRPLKIAMP